MSRIGKIARLPKGVREELNWRLLDGEQQSRLVEWLNGREEVQAVLRAEFSGQPINEPNLTAWVQGGFEDWRRQQEATEAAGRLAEESSALAAISGNQCLVDRVSMMAALALGEQLMAVRRTEDGTEKRKAVLKLVRGLVRLRKSDREQERGQREAAEAARAAEVHEDWAARMRPRKRKTEDADAGPEMSVVRKKMAEVLAGMSDEQIAESLRRSGHLPVRQSSGQTVVRQGSGPGQRLPPERVWWTEEDQALDEAEGEDEARSTGSGQTQRLEADEESDAADDQTPTASTSTSTSMSTNSNLPPEGGTTNASMGASAGRGPAEVQLGAAGAGRSTGSGQGDPRPTTGAAGRILIQP